MLTDILGDEDHLGDMDFKVAGTEEGVTALQMDLKIDSISPAIMQKALDQAREGRMHILGLMKGSVEGHRTELSEFAPRMIQMKINPEKIRGRDRQGRRGDPCADRRDWHRHRHPGRRYGHDRVDRQLEGGAGEESVSKRSPLKSKSAKIYEGPVVKILEFGAIVNIMPGRDGLLHVSQIANKRVEHVTDYLKEGQVLRVKVLETDERGKIRLSLKAVQDIEPLVPAQQ